MGLMGLMGLIGLMGLMGLMRLMGLLGFWGFWGVLELLGFWVVLGARRPDFFFLGEVGSLGLGPDFFFLAEGRSRAPTRLAARLLLPCWKKKF